MDAKWLTLCWLHVILLSESTAQRYVGCYKDTLIRALNIIKGNVNGIDDCINRCRRIKAPYAGLQYGHECFCGTNYKKYGKSSGCTLKCQSGQICGGNWANSVYSVDPLACSCSVSGDPHYKTFDGQMIHFMGTCKYTLATTTTGAPNYFAVEVKNEHRGNNRVSYTRMVDVKLEQVTIRLLPGNKMLVNGRRTTPPLNNFVGVSAVYSGGWIIVSTNWGLQVQFDGRHRASVKVPAAFATKLSGICGDCNGKQDDLRTKNGTDVSKNRNRFSEVGKSHQVKDDSDKPQSNCDVTDVNTNCTPDQTQRCDVINDQIFYACRQELGDERVKEYLNACKIDACVYHDEKDDAEKVVCEAIEGFARECEEAGFTLNWRGVSKCVLACPPNQQYQFNASECQPSCTKPKQNCDKRQEACVCQTGYVLSGEDCVPKSQCGCMHNGEYMKVNEEVIDENCTTKYICKSGGTLVSENMTCEENSECSIANGKRMCVCRKGFYRNKKCFPQECEKTMADIVFLLDDSQHMVESNSVKMKEFVKEIVSSFNIGDEYVRVGSVSFSNWEENNFHLNHHSNMSALLNAVDAIKRRKTTYFIANALDYLRTKSFTIANGDRINALNVAIIITDGKPEIGAASLKAIKSLKTSGIIILAIGIGKKVQVSDLSPFGSEPSQEFVYNVESFDTLNRIKNQVNKRICSVHVCDTKPCKNGGKCVPKGKEFSCLCTDPFQGKDCSQMKPDCKCSVSGDPHYKTFDGQMIHFMGICKYTLASSTKNASEFFAVEVKNEHRRNNLVSYTRMVDVKLKGVIIRLLPGNAMLVNGEKRSLPITNILGFSAKFASGWITVSTKWGLQVQFDGRHRANVKVPATFINKLSGICGDCNGKKDDLRTKDGQDVSKDRDRFSKVGNSHKVKDDSDKPGKRCDDVTDVNTNCTPAQTQRCNTINHNIFNACRRELGDERVKAYFDSCKIDTCIYQNDTKLLEKVFCEAIEGFARECEKAGITVNWRGISKCGLACSRHTVYKFNASECQPSCREPHPKCQNYVEACVCKAGYILSGNECVRKSQCGCISNGIYMKINEEITDSNCKRKTVCTSHGKLVRKRLSRCQANSECRIENGKRSCVCKKGFQLRNRTCKAKPCFLNPCKHGGTCTENGDDFRCLCDEAFYGKYCSKKKPDCRCSVSGDPHYRTFDGQMIHFMGICKYTLATTTTTKAPHYFAVEVKNEHRGNTRVSFTRMVDIKLLNATIRLSPGHNIFVNGEKSSLPINNILGFSAKYSGGWITVSTEWGLQVQFDGRHRANVKVPATFSSKLTGICGDCNGKKDDLRTKDGKDVSKDRHRFSKVGNSHKVNDDSDKPELRCDVNDVKTKCTSQQTQRCDVIQHKIFQTCSKKLGTERVKEYVDSCKIDACIYYNNSKLLEKVVCESIEGFVRECEQAGLPLDWRGVSKCGRTCSTNQVYKFNALVCQPSCTEPNPKCDEREEACVCKAGYILSGDDCVPKSKCGCMSRGVYMKINEERIDSKCQTKTICRNDSQLISEKLLPCQKHSECRLANGRRTCVCKEGFELRDGKCKVLPCYSQPCKNGGKCKANDETFNCTCEEPFYGNDCSKRKPDCRCSVSGDPHYRTFDGQMIHFMGICKYTLAKSTNVAPYSFAVEVKNEHRGNKRVSYTRMVDIILPNVTIRLLPGHNILVNGEKRSLPMKHVLGFSAKFSGGWITVSTEWGLYVQFDGRHRANVKVPATFANRLTGICGDCNGKKDDLRTKDGQDVSKDRDRFSKVGNSHKVKDDSDKPEAKCDVDGINETCTPAQTQRCDVMRHKIFQTCSQKLGDGRIKEYWDSCKIDACAYHEDEKVFEKVICESVEGFARECEEAGFTLDWRGVSKCPLICLPNQVYQFNASICQPSCTEPQPKCEEHEEACVCKAGYILSGENCVPKSQCGCLHNGVYMKINEEITDSNCKTKIVCTSGGKLVRNQLSPCQANSECSIENGKRSCVCKEGFQLRNGKCKEIPPCSCSASGDPHYKTFDGQMIHFMGICKYTLATSTEEAPHMFSVEVKNEHRRNTRVSYTRMVDIKLPNVTIRLLPGHKMLVNAEKRTLPINNVLGFSAKYSGSWITVSTEWGLQVQFDGRHRANVKVPATFSNKLSGICGDCNGKKDDLRTKDGNDVSKDRDRFSKVGNSHKVKDDSDKPELRCDVSDVNTTCTPDETKMCDVMQHPEFKQCRAELGAERVQSYVDSCKIDACIYRNDSNVFKNVVCEAIEGFARECEQHGFLLDWRGMAKCEMACPQNQVYKSNASACEATCSEPLPKCDKWEEACVCKKGYVISGEDCVPKSQCGCMNNSTYMKVNEELLDSDCRTKIICKTGGKLETQKLSPCQAHSTCRIENGQRSCVCDKGFILRGGKCTPKAKPCFLNPCKHGGTCTENGDDFRCLCDEAFYGKYCSKKKPDCRCSVSGDPHYRTFDGQMIHFMGICKYTLATTTTKAPHYFAVEVKNEHRGNTRVSFTRMVDIKLLNATIRLSPGHNIFVNGEKSSLPINNILGFSAKYSGGWITVSTEWGLQVQFDGRHRANVKVPATFSSKLTGICGDCNGKKDDLRTKDGKDVSKDRHRFSKVGNSHKVNDDSDKPELRCDVNDVKTKCTSQQTQRCDVIQHKIFQTCSKKLGTERVKEYVDSCKIDACIYYNNSKLLEKVVCESIEGFVRECEQAGLPLDWRGVSKCGRTCSTNQVYKFNALVCQPSCTEPNPKCDEREEACVCKAGYILSGDDCVPKSKCGCMSRGVYMKINEERIDSKCQTKTICRNDSQLISEKLQPCQKHSECRLANGRRACVCKEGFELRDGKCKVLPCYSQPCKNGGKCKANDETFNCTCEEPFYGNDCSKRKPDCRCSVSGDPHYRTFDGQMIHFMGICKYTLAKSTNVAPYSFAVEVKNEHRGNKRVSYTRMVDIILPNVTIRLLPGHNILVNGEKRSLPMKHALGFSAKFSGGWITVSTEWGLYVQFDGRHRANVKVPATFANRLTGICGDCNGKKDDMRTKDGQDVSKDRDRFSKVGNSHKVKDDSDKPEAKCDVDMINETCTPAQTQRCDVMRHKIFQTCSQKLGDDRIKEYWDSCKIDACAYHEDEKVFEKVICESVEGFARECEEAGFTLDWRGVSKCPLICLPNQVYQFNASVCQPSCTEPQPKCEEHEEACVCKAGYILSGENCVPKSQCGCLHNGVYMKINEEITDSNCKTKIVCTSGGKLVRNQLSPCQANSECSIENGKRSCVCKEGFQLRNGKCKEIPPCSCSASGDPHYKTFDGQMIHFMGICKYTLATSTEEAPHMFSVEVKNEHRRNTRVSYTRMVDIKLPNVTIRLLPGHKMLVNAEKRTLPINNVLGFSAKYSGSWITVSTEWGLQVQFDGRHRANVKVPATFSNKLSGICGDCNGKKDDLRTKDGNDVSKDRDRFSKVGNSHKVKDDSDKPELRCDVSDVNTTCTPDETKMCDVMQHPEFKQCRAELGAERVQSYVDSCKIDACIYRNDSNVFKNVVCEAIEGFARECEQHGFLLDWRGMAKCEMACPQNQVYKSNASACEATCSEPLPKCDKWEEACVCKKGYVISGEDCVPKSQCGCMNNSTYMKVNEELLDSDCRTKIICKTGGKLETQKLSPCQAHSTCRIENGQRSCVCDQGFILRGGKCTPKVDPCEAHPCQNGGKCIRHGLTRTCECQAQFEGSDCSKGVTDCECSVSGDPHYKTFDGQWIHFMGTCKYTLATIKSASRLPYFAVEVKNEHRGNTRVSYTRLVDLKLYGVKIRLLQGNQIMVNGELMTLPLTDYMGFSANFAAGWITVSTDYGINVQFDGRHRVNVRVPKIYKHELTGICGDCNGKKDDYKTEAGVDVSEKTNKFSLIGDSYRVLDDTDSKNCTAVDAVETCGPSETTFCNIMKLPTGPFAACVMKLGPDASGIYNSCVIDICAYKDKPKLKEIVRCQALENLARKCEEIGVSVKWRDQTKCLLDCPLNKIYKHQTSACQPSCTNLNPVCDAPSIEGCVCKPGTVLSGTECVPWGSCGCNVKGRYMKPESSVLLSDCSKRITCTSSGNVGVQLGCGANTMCAIEGGIRRCVCQTGYQMLNGKCRQVFVPQPPIVDPEFLGPVMHMFVRVSIAYLKGNPLVDTGKYTVTYTETFTAESCAVKCLKTKICRSFNYNQLHQTCVLLSINAEEQMLSSSDCPYQDYYQLIDNTTININGAAMLSCNDLRSIQKVNTWRECQKLCADAKCKAIEYSSFKKTCSMTNDTRKSHGLTGDELWTYQEQLQKLPTMPDNI